MEVCPVCEAPHAREALECATCGHIFRMAAVDESIVPLADLEPTRAADLEVGTEITPGLEPTRFEDVPSMSATTPEARIEGLEPTLAAPQEVAVEATPDLEPTALVEEDPSLFAVDVTCPNCGEVAQGEETFCAKCGMRLPRVIFGEPPTVTAEMACTSCGGTSFIGGICSRCGARQPAID